MAVTGPIVTTRSLPGNRLLHVSYRGGKRDAIPLYHVNRSYRAWMERHGLYEVGDYFSEIRPYRHSMSGVWPSQFDKMYARAYDKLVSNVHSKVKASMAVTLLETRQSLTMIDKRVNQLIDFGTALRKRDFSGVVRALGLAKDETLRLGRKSHRQARKDKTRLLKTVWDKQSVKPAAFANNYLELVFGWAPLVQDIGDAMSVLGREFDSRGLVRGRAKDLVDEVRTEPLIWNSQPARLDRYLEEDFIHLQARIRISNPNLLLASELGLVNLAQVAWNVIPYSFLIDAFVGVSRYLGSYSDFAGLELRDAFVSRLCVCTHDRSDDWGGMGGRFLEVTRQRSHQFIREPVPTFSVPTLKSRVGLPVHNLLGRATSSVALFVQQLTKGK